MAIVRKISDSDGKCYALKKIAGILVCDVMYGIHSKCGTYMCPFYKPKDCKDWLRKENEIILLSPEEFELGAKHTNG